MRRSLSSLCLVGFVMAATGCGDSAPKSSATTPLPKAPIRQNGEVYKVPAPPHK